MIPDINEFSGNDICFHTIYCYSKQWPYIEMSRHVWYAIYIIVLYSTGLFWWFQYWWYFFCAVFFYFVCHSSNIAVVHSSLQPSVFSNVYLISYTFVLSCMFIWIPPFRASVDNFMIHYVYEVLNILISVTFRSWKPPFEQLSLII